MGTDKNWSFNSKDVLLIGYIVVGFTKMVNNIITAKPKTHAQHHCITKTALNILQTLNLTTMKKESDFEADYNGLRGVGDRELEALADKKSKLFIISHKGVDYKNYYITAGFFFRV